MRYFYIILFVIPIVTFAQDSISYSLKFSNNSNAGDMSLLLNTAEGVALLDGITKVNPIALPTGRSKDVKFLIKGNATSWQLRFTLCKNSSITASDSKCFGETETICQFDASGVGDLPFYMSNSQSSSYKCSPDAIANQQHVHFSVSND